MVEETELARRAAAGDANAFAALVRIHEAPVRRFLSRLVRGDGAEDIAQEVFLQAWRMRTHWRGDGMYGAWLMRIAWTSFLSSHRSKARRQLRDHTAYERSDSATVVDADLSIDLSRALASLEPRERAAAQLCLAEGYSHADAARVLELPLGTLKSIVARARTRLAQALEAAR